MYSIALAPRTKERQGEKRNKRLVERPLEDAQGYPNDQRAAEHKDHDQDNDADLEASLLASALRGGGVELVGVLGRGIACRRQRECRRRGRRRRHDLQGHHLDGARLGMHIDARVWPRSGSSKCRGVRLWARMMLRLMESGLVVPDATRQRRHSGGGVQRAHPEPPSAVRRLEPELLLPERRVVRISSVRDRVRGMVLLPLDVVIV
ncbi:hypothetical protein Trco_003566 [Trichoderma cornu-damae]|uniref:Uncharacterized protein n=1 Tax=Trichoderma cornu-damae TaxID=654480 RepID=A0A9P8TWA1_9HYPO|nr:hypothetical protein Trco_003566 [Trichoderma cornu-damae]